MVKVDLPEDSDLTLVSFVDRPEKSCEMGRHALFLCVCGSTIIRAVSRVKTGRVKRCRSCQSKKHSKDMIRMAASKGSNHRRIYRIYSNMKSRCYNKNIDSYERYGGRGIFICDEWLNDFKKFEGWSLSNGYEDSLSVDRTNNDGPYSPLNCRWVSPRQQALNSRLRSDNSTGERCVSPVRGKYQLTIDAKYYGLFKTVKEAVLARDLIINNDRIV